MYRAVTSIVPVLRALSIFCLVVFPIRAQGTTITREDLSRSIEGRVEDWTDDGFLTLRYPFDRAGELLDFESQTAAPDLLRVEKGHLVFRRGDAGEDEVVLRLGEVHWQPPFSLRMNVTPRWPNAGLLIVLADSSERGGQTIAAVNASTEPSSDERIHGLLLLPPGARTPRPRQRRAASDFEADRSVEVAITVQDGELDFSVGGRLVASEPRFLHASFQVLLAPTGPAIEVDEIRLHGRPVEASLRKLLRGSAARESKDARDLDSGNTAMSAFARERLQEPLPPAARRAFSELEPRTKDLLGEARKAEGGLDLEDAALWYEEAAALEPDATVAWRAGRARLLAGDHERALVSLEQATRLDPELAPAWRDLAACLGALEKDDEAIKAFERALELDPNDALAATLFGIQLFGRGRLAEAREQFHRAMEAKPEAVAASMLLRDVERLQAPPAWDPIFKAETAHYRISTNVSEPFAQRVASQLEQYREFLEKLRPLPESVKPAPSQVWIFDSRGEYNVFAGTLMSRTVERTAGVYHPAIRTLLLFDEIDRESTLDTLFHEGFHQYVDLVNQNVPIWFNEGMAEFFGATRFDDEGRGFAAIQLERLRELLHVLATEPDRIPDFDELLRMPKVRFYEPDSISLNYAVAWSLCFYFLGAPDRGANVEAKTLFAEYSDAIFAGASGDEAYARSFGKPGARKAESFKPNWRRFVELLR